VKLIAFYLPQFYENEINNKNWGKGFTEWTHIIQSSNYNTRIFKPIMPTELGYYDLKDDNVRHAQARLAKEYGISAWCYYYYRFNGQRFLDLPLERHFDDKKLDMPFLICWANENWTRSWDGLANNILVKQEHNLEDDINFIKEVGPMLIDDRYFKINGKPVVLIYRTELWDNIKKTVNIWRSYMSKTYNKEIYLIRCHGFDRKTNPSDIDFDASYQFPPFNLQKSKDSSDYSNFNSYAKEKVSYKLFRGVMSGFCNIPRKKERGDIHINANPINYKIWLKEAIRFTIDNFSKKEEHIIFINAWNEWGEGAVLEPSNQWGREYLEKTKECLIETNYEN
jgi:lipopolysaccharide biosynthesis protein